MPREPRRAGIFHHNQQAPHALHFLFSCKKYKKFSSTGHLLVHLLLTTMPFKAANLPVLLAITVLHLVLLGNILNSVQDARASALCTPLQL
jgi:hypothetical protein